MGNDHSKHSAKAPRDEFSRINLFQ